jgi:lysine decarboxylase
MDAGADVCVVSAHKMGTGFEQGSVFHRQAALSIRTTCPPAPSKLLRTRRA